ncbi:hypothetical protein J5277_09410 [Rhizobium sp. 16-449-1b]|uniref:DUF6950 family protein n=1 Tax=Rhizobium sp. 16-449-1b TaxID=2819989 RepID=UPI001ADB5DBF|nr:hypothetical protein [Rhizobium sp. 16-449-1b]MBO9194321.1 hypothetical protein [Rhizobium sp. 16-449-1b]
MTLHEFLALPHRFRWGGSSGDDCTMFCASWVEELTGTDPAADIRGTYRDAAGAHRIIDAAGGLVQFARGRLEPLGFVPTDAPVDGDLGVVRAPAGMGDGMTLVSAIRFGPLWAILAPAGVIARKLEHVAAWRLKR